MPTYTLIPNIIRLSKIERDRNIAGSCGDGSFDSKMNRLEEEEWNITIRKLEELLKIYPQFG